MNKVNRIGMLKVTDRIPIVENGYISKKDILDNYVDVVADMVADQLAYEELMLNSLVHFCNTGKFLTEEE